MRRLLGFLAALAVGSLLVVGLVQALDRPARAAEAAAPAADPLDVVINEVAWMGTAASANDEWIELLNTTDEPITITGWLLRAADDTPTIALSGVIPPHGYFLLERTDDNTVSDILADQVYGNDGSSWALNNTGEMLSLLDGYSTTIDTANGNGGSWPAGNNTTKSTMERRDPLTPDTDANWCTNDGVTRNGHDALGNPLNGTPRAQNSCYQPPVTPLADLDVGKSGPTTVHAGDLITYEIALVNVGAAVATDTRLTDTLPLHVSFFTQTSSFTFTWVGRDLVWQLGDMPTSTPAAISVVGRVAGAACGALLNVVTATTTASETVIANNVDSWTTTVVVPHAPLDVVINEVAWMGTAASDYDEWIELHNTTAQPINLSGWMLTSDDGSPNIALVGTIAAGGYFLLERTDDTTVSDIPADQIYTGDLVLGGETLRLRDDLGAVIDTANGDGGGWPAGTNDPDYTMERRDPLAPDADANWCTNDGVTRNGLDADGNPLNGTPRAQNSCYQPPRADLAVGKSGTAALQPGDLVTYIVTVGNAGSLAAADVRLTDTLPSVVTFITQTSPFTFTHAGQELVWQVGELAPAVQATVWITGQVAEAIWSPFTNTVVATTVTTETVLGNNDAAWRTDIAVHLLSLPTICRAYTPPRYGLVIEAVLYDGWQSNDTDEAVLLLNGGDLGVDLTGWQLCKWGTTSWSCANLPAVTIAAGQRLWLARSASGFAASFGFPPDYVLSGWPALANEGDEAVLRDPRGFVRDALVFESGDTTIDGWDGPALQPYAGSSFALEGQVLYRFPDEASGLPFDDTDTALDWAQRTDDPWNGRRVRYPGWDLERFFPPAVEAGGTVTVGIAPDNGYQVVLDTVRAAQESIEIEAYTLRHYDLVDELVQRAQAGVSVTVLLEGSMVGVGRDDPRFQQEMWACQQLHATGHGLCYFMVTSDTLHIHDRYDLIHAKFMIVDRERLLVTSQNFTHSGVPSDDKANGTGGSRGVVVVTDAPGAVARAVEVFEADCDPAHHADITLWAVGNPFGFGPPLPGFTPDLPADWVTYTVQFSVPVVAAASDFELLTAPESVLRHSDALLGLLTRAGAGDEVYVEQLYEYPSWAGAPNLRLESYIAAARRGARVRVLLNGGMFGEETYDLSGNVEAAAYLNAVAQAEGLDMSAHLGDPTRYGIHNKMVLVWLHDEGGYVHLGSINGSESSSKVNREVALQFRSDEAYATLRAVFEYDWLAEPPLRHLLVSEVTYRPRDQSTGNREWVELYNPTAEAVDLSGWYLGDGLPGEYGSGLYTFPPGSLLPAGGVIVIAQQSQDAGFTPHYEFLIDPYRDDPSVPNMLPAGSWDGFGFALGDPGDEVLLLDPAMAAVDVVTYGTGSYPGVVPHPGGVEAGHSLERRPPEQDTDDCSRDFFDRYPPTPGTLSHIAYRESSAVGRPSSVVD